MSSILKWTVPIDDNEHEIGSGPLVHVSQQGNPRMLQVWTLEPDPPTEDYGVPTKKTKRVAKVVGTGHHFDGWAWRHGGSYVDTDHGLVWHLLYREETV